MSKKVKGKPKEKKSRRARSKFPALRPELNLRSRYESIDYDYIDQLSEKDKEWLNTFTEEYTNANFNHGKSTLHKTKKLKKDCYNRNNSRNRDILTRAKAAGECVYIEDLDSRTKNLLESTNQPQIVRRKEIK